MNKCTYKIEIDLFLRFIQVSHTAINISTRCRFFFSPNIKSAFKGILWFSILSFRFKIEHFEVQ